MWVPHPLKSVAAASPSHTALREGNLVVTYAQLLQKVQSCAGFLAAQGVKEGHRVALLGPLCVDWVVAFHAVGWLGAAVVPVPSYVADSALFLQDMSVFYVCDVSSALWKNAEAVVMQPVAWPLEGVRCVLKTSGTTGKASCVALTTAQVMFSALGSMLRMGCAPSDVWLLCLPVAHAGGMGVLWRALWGGACVLLQPVFDPRAVNHAVDSDGVTRVSMVPTMLEQVLDVRGEKPFPASVTVLLGGAKASEALLRVCEQKSVPVVITWGMTETSGTVTLSTLASDMSQGDVGVPHVFAEVVSHHATLHVQGPTALGEHVSSDVGTVDEEGHVHVWGRADDVCVSGGYKIHPQEVEACIGAFPGVAEVCVVGKPSVRWGESVVAFVVPQDASMCPSEEALVAFCRERLPSFKIPSVWVWCDALVKNETGKSLRRVYRQHLHMGKPLGELLGDGTRCECVWIDETVYKAYGCAQHATFMTDVVFKSKGAGALLGHVCVDDQNVAQPGGGFVGGFTVHQGGSPSPLGESAFQVAQHAGNKFLKSMVAVGVEMSKKNDASAIDLVESDGDAVFKGHEGLVHPVRVVGES
jgi:O-succinylbenzoic acid--CoA ligase